MNANGRGKTQIHAFVLTVIRQVLVAVAMMGRKVTPRAELYNPATGTWSRTVKLNSLSSAELCTP
jgi:hypothetical protein